MLFFCVCIFVVFFFLKLTTMECMKLRFEDLDITLFPLNSPFHLSPSFYNSYFSFNFLIFFLSLTPILIRFLFFISATRPCMLFVFIHKFLDSSSYHVRLLLYFTMKNFICLNVLMPEERFYSYLYFIFSVTCVCVRKGEVAEEMRRKRENFSFSC